MIAAKTTPLAILQLYGDVIVLILKIEKKHQICETKVLSTIKKVKITNENMII